MRLEGRRESENVEDRRGMGTGAKIGLGGIGGCCNRLAAWAASKPKTDSLQLLRKKNSLYLPAK